MAIELAGSIQVYVKKRPLDAKSFGVEGALLLVRAEPTFLPGKPDRNVYDVRTVTPASWQSS
jgi:hypothetical protein